MDVADQVKELLTRYPDDKLLRDVCRRYFSLANPKPFDRRAYQREYMRAYRQGKRRRADTTEGT